MPSRTRPSTLEALESRRLLAADIGTEAVGLTGSDVRRILNDATAQVVASVDAAPYWVDEADPEPTLGRGVDNRIHAVAMNGVRLNRQALIDSLADAPAESPGGARPADLLSLPTLYVPTPDGSFQRFAVQSTTILSPDLAAKYPDIRTFRGWGIDDPAAIAQFDHTQQGFHAQVLSPSGAYMVDPYEHMQADGTYVSYFRQHAVRVPGEGDGHDVVLGEEADHDHDHDEDDHHHDEFIVAGPAETSTSNIRRNYRAAIATTGEYAQFHGGTVASALSAIATTLARVDGVYERDLNISFTLVPNNDQIVFTNAGSDPYNNSDTFQQINANQGVIDGAIGNANYDIGHVFSTASGGLASLGVVGETGAKARGVTGISSPIGDPFDIDYVAHEFGHQFGGSHTFNGVNGSCSGGNRSNNNAYEPGSGSTIQAYAGICGADNLQSNSDPYFHARSIFQINTYTASGVGSGFNNTNTGNNAPTVNAGVGMTIPARTPFEIVASGGDIDGDAVTFTFEQYDLGDAEALGAPDDGNGPLFRSRMGTTSNVRSFPELADILAGREDADEILPKVSRNGNDLLSIRVTARDGVGGVQDSQVNHAVINTGSAFEVTTANSPGTTWGTGSTQTVSWNVAGTTANGINTADVDIFLSYDNGQTFTLVANDTPNDGSASITIPASAPTTSTARVKIKGAGNIFFDINNAPIAIEATGPVVPNGLPATLTLADDGAIYAGPGGDFADADFELDPFTASPDLTTTSDVDSYVFAVDQQGTYTFTASDVAGGGTVFPILAVYDADTGMPIATSSDGTGTTNSVDVFLTVWQRVIVAVADEGNVAAGDITLDVEGPGQPVTFLSLDAAGDRVFNSTIDDRADSDFYAFTLPSNSNGSGTIAVSTISSDTVLSLYDSSNNLIAFDDQLGTTGQEVINFTGLTPGAVYRVRVGTFQYGSSVSAYTLTINADVPVAPPAPSAPMLQAIADTGVSNSDGITMTNDNLPFSVMAAQGQFVQLYRDGLPVGDLTQVTDVSGNVTVADPTGPLADGSYVYTATAISSPGGPESPASGGSTVVIDTVGPTQSNFNFIFDSGPIDQRFFVDFDELGADLDVTDIVVTNTTTGQVVTGFRLDPISGGQNDLIYDPTAGADFLPNGVYEVTVATGTFSDAAGNGNSAFLGSDFFLNGDANRDGTVSILDFAILRANFGSSTNPRFSTADFNYDGTVSILDFAILRSNFGQSLASRPASIFAEDDQQDVLARR